jgi:hypothetical protein
MARTINALLYAPLSLIGTESRPEALVEDGMLVCCLAWCCRTCIVTRDAWQGEGVMNSTFR